MKVEYVQLKSVSDDMVTQPEVIHDHMESIIFDREVSSTGNASVPSLDSCAKQENLHQKYPLRFP